MSFNFAAATILNIVIGTAGQISGFCARDFLLCNVANISSVHVLNGKVAHIYNVPRYTRFLNFSHQYLKYCFGSNVKIIC